METETETFLRVMAESKPFTVMGVNIGKQGLAVYWDRELTGAELEAIRNHLQNVPAVRAPLSFGLRR